MKIVINRCFGGFGLSTEAVAEYAKLKGLKHVRTQSRYLGDGYDLLTPNFDLPDVITDAQWNDEKNKIHSDRDIERSDQDLVLVVEKLGEKANGHHTKLEVVEIPDGIEYTIEEYDGNEHVAEKHRTW